MAKPPSTDPSSEAPWASRREVSGRHLVRRSLPWIALAAFAALIVWGLWPKPVIVETGAVTRGPLTVHVSEEGKTRIRNRYIVAAPVAGTMRRVALKPGDRVEASATALTTIGPHTTPLLDPRARAQAEAQVAMAEAAAHRAAESLEAARAALLMAEADRDRMRSVRKDGTLSASDRDRMEAEASIRAAEVRAAGFALQVARHELENARAALSRPASDAADTPVEVKSPVSGVVLNVMLESETIVSPGTAILEIGDPADIEIEAEILSRDAVAIRPGDSVEVDHWGGEAPLKARVRRIEPAAFTKISALGVEEQRVFVLADLIDPPEQAKALGDRFRVEARIAVWHSDDVLVAPAGALFREGNLWKTFVHRAGRAALVTVEAGHTDGRRTEILTGLKPGERVLLHPPDTVADGTAVIESAEPAAGG
jgi:HlyD family secretion protein